MAVGTRRTLTALVLAPLVLLAAGSGAGCGRPGSPPVKGPEPGTLPRYRVDHTFRLTGSATWTAARERGHLVVGAKEDQPYMGEKDPADGVYSGFDIEIAKMMAASLGFGPAAVRFRTIASANRETALQNGQIDYYVGTYTINDKRKRLVGFAGPYYMASTSPCSYGPTSTASTDRATSTADASARPRAPPRTSGSRTTTRVPNSSRTTPTRSVWTIC